MHSLAVFSAVAGLSLTFSHSFASAQTLYDQCGGVNYTGSKACPPSSKCEFINEYFSQCLPTVSNVERAECAAQYGQCGGKDWKGATCCPSGWSCQFSNDWYSQCLQGGAAVTPSTSPKPSSTSTRQTTVAPTTSTRATTTTSRVATSTTSRSTQAPSSTAAPAASGFLGGLNIAGFEFGISVWGWAGTYVAPPTSQISHFVNQGVNVIRLPFAWQYIESSPGAGLNAAYFDQYDAYVQQILKSGAHVILDLHNYGRWNSGVVGADGPTTAQFAALWSSLAKKYASQSKIIFGLMNEPHDLDAFGGMASWTKQIQAAVNAIRAAGAKTQPILLSGDDWTGAASFLSKNLPSLKTVTDPVGGTNLLWFDIHQYLDANTSGTSTECVSDKVSELFAPISAELKRIGRKAFLSEIGGGSTASCELHLKNALAHIKANSGVWQGFSAWAAGSFGSSYELSLTPNGNTDTSIWTKAIKPNLPAAGKRMKKRHSAEQH